jgi:hypothetical protein
MRHGTALRGLIVLVGLALFTPTTRAGERDAEIEAIVDRAVADWSRLLSCTALEPEGHRLNLEFWRKERKAILDAMLTHKIAGDVAGRIARKTDPKSMMSAHERSARDLVAYCATDRDWMRKAQQFKIIVPSRELGKLPAP